MKRIHQLFNHRSGRVVAVGRLTLASVFLLAIWLDPSQPSRAPAEGYAVLALYVLFAASFLVITWRSWRLDRRLALPAHMLDIAVFTVMVFLTEGYTSPFFTFFVFLLLSATIRWGWRETALTAVVVVPLFLAAGVATLVWGGAEFELRRFLIRAGYLAVLSLILIWFGVHQQSSRYRRAADLDAADAAEAMRSLLDRVLAFAAQQTGARRIVFAWHEDEEPWLAVAATGQGEQFQCDRLSPEAYDHVVAPELASSAFIFESGRAEVVVQEAGGRTRIRSPVETVNPRFADRFGVGAGLVVPVETADQQGHLFVLEVPGLCSDTLKIGTIVSHEMAASLERLSKLKASEEAAATRARLSLARDLHDNIVQLLSGTSFRLESIRTAAAAGRDVSSRIEALQQELSREQRDLRQFITRLRGAGDCRPTEIGESLRSLAHRLSRQWGVECVVLAPSSTQVPQPLEHELHQLVREAVANAVRHGNAGRVTISIAASGGTLLLEVIDDGSGFAHIGDVESSHPAAVEMEPRSLSERVRTLGGELDLTSSSAGSRIRIELPLKVNE